MAWTLGLVAASLRMTFGAALSRLEHRFWIGVALAGIPGFLGVKPLAGSPIGLWFGMTAGVVGGLALSWAYDVAASWPRLQRPRRTPTGGLRLVIVLAAVLAMQGIALAALAATLLSLLSILPLSGVWLFAELLLVVVAGTMIAGATLGVLAGVRAPASDCGAPGPKAYR